MSIKAMSWAWEQQVDSNSKLILLALADHANDDGCCWPGIERISIKCGLSERSIIRKISDMIEKGLIKKSQNFDQNGRQKSNTYELILNKTDNILNELVGCQVVTPGCHDDRGEGDTVTPPYIETKDINKKPTRVLVVKKEKSNRGTQFPDDFILTNEHIELANSLDVDCLKEFEQFKDYALAVGKVYKNWNAGFRNWLRNSKKFSKGKGAGGFVPYESPMDKLVKKHYKDIMNGKHKLFADPDGH